MASWDYAIHQNLAQYVTNFPIFPPLRQHPSEEEDCQIVFCIYCFWELRREVDDFLVRHSIKRGSLIEKFVRGFYKNHSSFPTMTKSRNKPKYN